MQEYLCLQGGWKHIGIGAEYGQKNRKGCVGLLAVVAVVVSVAKILRANERSQLLASGSNAY